MTPDFDSITRHIAAVTGDSVDAASAVSLSGGSISRAWRLKGRQGDYFIKTNDASFDDNFAAEAEGLQALLGAASPAPSFVTRGTTAGHAYLVLDYLHLRPLDRDSGRIFGDQLAALHRKRGERFGWHRDNYIGATPQSNAEHPSWPHFFGQQRLLPQLQRAAAQGMERKLIGLGEGIIARLGGLFVDYHPAPSLLHGDLWSGNVAQVADGSPVLFDPACYFGDRETDLAMSELFGGFPDSFYAAYRAAWPLEPGYETRKTLYNLYHVLNHYNLFGDAYLGQARRMLERLAAELRR